MRMLGRVMLASLVCVVALDALVSVAACLYRCLHWDEREMLRTCQGGPSQQD